MNDRKICFITCVNDETKYRESLLYISRLNVPEQYEIETVAIRNAFSMAAGYNKGIATSDAKFKVYLHQDVMILNQNFISDMLQIFKSGEKIGMLGVVGAKTIPTNGIWWNSSEKVGRVYDNHAQNMELLELSKPGDTFQDVRAVGGLLFATQYDITFCEDLFKGWYFYDVSQTMEFIKQNYRVVVPSPEQPWCLHDCGVSSTGDAFEKYRHVFINKYMKESIPLVSILISTYNRPEFFELALNSVLLQTYPHIEIIVGDDSTDNTTEKLMHEKYLNRYKDIKYFHNEKNLGQFNNDLKLMDMAKGEYVNFLMDNDLFLETKIEKMMEYLLSDKNDEISLVTSHQVTIDESGNTSGISGNTDQLIKQNCIIDGKELGNFILCNSNDIIGNRTAVLFKKSKLKIPFGTFNGRRYHSHVDQAAWLSVLSRGKAVFINELLSFCRCNKSQQAKSAATVFGEVADYAHEVISARENGFLIDDVKFVEATKRGLNDIQKAFETIPVESLSSTDTAIYQECIDLSNKLLDSLQERNKGFFYLGLNSTIGDGFRSNAPQAISIGNDVHIVSDAYFLAPFYCDKGSPYIEIMDGCEIGNRCQISSANHIVIEKQVIIAGNVHITDHNHEYRKIGIPIRQQGIDSHENEVVIGQGSWIANNCVIVGNVHIGRGCVIGADSVVNKDIPDYCVAVGAPAKIIKYFDFADGKWKAEKDQALVSAALHERAKVKPLLTLGIFTYNRASYLKNCLQSIFASVGNDKLIEVLVCDNASTDETQEVVEKYQGKYGNLAYHRNEKNIGAEKNLLTALETASGGYVIAVGDDDYFADGFIYQVVNIIYSHRNCGLFYFNVANQKYSVDLHQGIDDFIKNVSYNSTSCTLIAYNKSELDKVQSRDKYIYSQLNQVYLQLSILKQNPAYCILTGIVFSGNAAAQKTNYNFGEVFIKNYLDILYSFKDNISPETLSNEKRKLMDTFILPLSKMIKDGHLKLKLDGIVDIYKDYFAGELFYEEYLSKLLEVLKTDHSVL